MSLGSMPPNCQKLIDEGVLTFEDSGMICSRCESPVTIFRKSGAKGFVWGEDILIVCPLCTFGVMGSLPLSSSKAPSTPKVDPVTSLKETL